MRCQRIVPLGLGLLTLGACAGPSGLSPGEDLSWARSALALGNAREAERYLHRIRESGALSAQGRTQASLLQAEIELRKEAPEEALRIANAHAADERFGAQAGEIAGKALIRLGRFGEAIARLETALNAYEDSRDVARTVDLISVAEGLEAYAGADPASARRHWSRIEDRTLRDSLRRALDQAAAVNVTARR
jgi:tetratricopeptide (TPR) repeat protein